jgi:SAM-dependent methyltransferase
MISNNTINNNVEWLSVYDSSVEKRKIRELLTSHGFTFDKKLNVVDIGCGNGRSIRLISHFLVYNTITAIDKHMENIQYAKENINVPNIYYLSIDAFDFFHKKNEFNIALFSWSLFDMVSNIVIERKEIELNNLMESVLLSIVSGGIIIVLQPTKGGTFEKLLTKFIPSSDDDYYITHNFLKKFGFNGPQSAIPNKDEPLTIWSRFNYKDEEQLFRGISSVLYLEANKVLTHNKFCELLDEFKIENGLSLEQRIDLTDCVNMYYFIKKEK